MEDQAPEEATDEQEVIATVHKVSDTMDTISRSLVAIAAYGHRTRQIAIALILSLALDLILTVVIGFLSYNSVMTADEVRAIQYSSCVSANQTRAENIQIWDFFVSLATAGIKEPPAQEVKIHNLLQFVDRTFAQRKC